MTSVFKAILCISLLWVNLCNAQYAPPPGYAGTTAIHKDSSVFVNWAISCDVSRGYQDLSDHSLGFASVGDSNSALGIAGQNGILSLGDGGSAILTFPFPISNGPGADFAVFENGFSNSFLELAHVEVSSDGINFFRFPSHSNVQTTIQLGAFDTMDTRLVHNLAGKYRALYGTPFDLNDLDTISSLDVNYITHIKIIDVVGSINSNYGSMDQNGNFINDPWPTPFPSSGFDLDAVGVINDQSPTSLDSKIKIERLTIFPNPLPAKSRLTMKGEIDRRSKIKIFSPLGKEIAFEIQYFDGGLVKIRLKEEDLSHGVFRVLVKSQDNLMRGEFVVF